VNTDDIRKRSLEIWAQERRRALHEAYLDRPLVPRVAAGAAAASGGGQTDCSINEYVENDYICDYFE
jgi:hypothetical protein